MQKGGNALHLAEKLKIKKIQRSSCHNCFEMGAWFSIFRTACQFMKCKTIKINIQFRYNLNMTLQLLLKDFQML